jgi:uncharacterized protein YegL
MSSIIDLTPLKTKTYDLNGDIQLQKEIQNIKIAKDKYESIINSMTSSTDTDIIDELANKLRFAQLRYAILHELKAQNLQLSNATNKIFYPTEDANCDVCYNELIDIDGNNHNWKVRTCGHVGCNYTDCASNSLINGAHTASGVSISCSLCRQMVRGIFQGGNNIKKQRLGTPMKRQLTCMTQSDDLDYDNFTPGIMRLSVPPDTAGLSSAQVLLKPGEQVNKININPDDIEEKEIHNNTNNITSFKSYLAMVNHIDHECTAVLATEVIEQNQTLLSQGHIDVLDISGSMSDEIHNIKKTLITKIESMSNNDYYSLIVFNDIAYTIITFEKASIENKTKWINLIKTINAVGGTSYTAAINELIALLNEIKQVSPSLFSRTKVLIMGDGAGDIDDLILPQLFDLNVNLYGITIGNNVNVETIKTVIGQVYFDQGNYRHYDNNNLFELITSMDLLASSFVKDVKIIVKNATIDSSSIIINENGDCELIYKYHGLGVKRLRLTDMKPESEIIISYGENIKCEYDIIMGDSLILSQFCSYRKVGSEILKCTKMEEIDAIIASITEEKFGEHTDIITNLANTKKQEIDPDLYPNITTPIQYSQNYTQNTIAALSARSTTSVRRAKSGI